MECRRQSHQRLISTEGSNQLEVFGFQVKKVSGYCMACLWFNLGVRPCTEIGQRGTINKAGSPSLLYPLGKSVNKNLQMMTKARHCNRNFQLMYHIYPNIHFANLQDRMNPTNKNKKTFRFSTYAVI